MISVDLLDRLRKARILRHLPLGVLDRLASRSRILEFAVGETLIEEGHAGDSVYLILSGQVAIRRSLGTTESALIAMRGVGDWIGEMALVDEGLRAATATAEAPVRVLEADREVFLEVISGSAEAALDLLRTLTSRLRESDTLIIQGLREKNDDLTQDNRRLRRENWRLRGDLDDCQSFEAFLGTSSAARRVREAARRAAGSELPVLLMGETGTGKEILARAIHAGRDDAREFVAINCGLFSEQLLESELFGHARGAFTGATATRHGLVEAADGGTLFLDEIADMPRPLQAALLRFLELGEYRRVGETKLRRARVRVIAATHVDLHRAVDSGHFRSDLLYRLDVIQIPIPPLRERRDDLPLLASHFLKSIAHSLRVQPLSFSAEALATLGSWSYPGNVRELQNELQRLYVALEPGAVVSPQDLSSEIVHGHRGVRGGYAEAVRAFKEQLVVRALNESEGNRGRAAERLGLHRSNLTRMIRDLGLEQTSPRSEGARTPVR